MNEPSRKMLVAVKPCGCFVMIETIEDPRDGYKATAKDIAEFYKTVHKYQTRKKNPFILEVREIRDPIEIKSNCDQCEVGKPTRATA